MDQVPQPYYFPIGFQGYGLKVQNKYDINTDWLSMNENIGTWIVLFHGTASTNIESILKSYLKPGICNAYGGSICRITNQEINSGLHSNVYLPEKVEEAEIYSKSDVDFNGKKFKVIFQCRVNPLGVRSPQSHPSYYTVSNPQQDIRPNINQRAMKEFKLISIQN